ncbi:hypothetical protein [Natronorubrum texcoconense]|uniref:Uncharacterized protein n=1 Tax=Natronorubrum texcoconense TaxID=1095776 RepID=A0A1G9A9M6_9EURY|nr:hypothetical protein [Natronorubrum texcoconense]SDK24066.1 hypothetical protein SAMN04515672_2636 [Natronorubrum texcoconense]
MTTRLQWTSHETIAAVLVAGAVIGAGLLGVVEPTLQSVSIAIVGVVIGFALLIPYVPGIDIGHLPLSTVGVLVASTGVFGMLTDTGAATLRWVFLLGGVGIVLEDQLRRKR